MVKLTLYTIVVLSMLFGVWVRNTMNKKSGKGLLKKIRNGTLSVQDIVAELIWIVESCRKEDVDFIALTNLKAGEKVNTSRGAFNIEYIEFLDNGDLVIAVFGHENDAVGVVEHVNTDLYFFLIHFNTANDAYEVKSEISTKLSEKLFKKEFAQSLLGVPAAEVKQFEEDEEDATVDIN